MPGSPRSPRRYLWTVPCRAHRGQRSRQRRGLPVTGRHPVRAETAHGPHYDDESMFLPGRTWVQMTSLNPLAAPMYRISSLPRCGRWSSARAGMSPRTGPGISAVTGRRGQRHGRHVANFPRGRTTLMKSCRRRSVTAIEVGNPLIRRGATPTVEDSPYSRTPGGPRWRLPTTVKRGRYHDWLVHVDASMNRGFGCAGWLAW